MGPDKSLQTFISYSRINQQFAIRLACELKSAGFCVWMDQFDIPTGSRWDDEIEKALRESQIFLFIMTPASIASENAKDEVGYAIDHGKRILPVLLEECEIPLRLRRLQYVDFTKKSFNEGIASAKELLSRLVEEIGNSASKAVEPAYETTNRKEVIRTSKEPKTAPTRSIKSYQSQPASKRRRKPPLKVRAAVIGIGVVCILTTAAIVLQPWLFTSPPIPSPTFTSAPTQTIIPTKTADPASDPVIPTEISRSFTEDFNSEDQFNMDWTHLLRHGNSKKESNFQYEIADENLIVNVTFEYTWGYFFHKPPTNYNSISLEAVVADLNFADTFGLICQFSDQGWYEFDINGGGRYEVRYVSSMDTSRDEDQFRIDYGSIPGFKYSLETTSENTIGAICDGNHLSLSVNDQELMKDYPSRFELEQGQIGFAVRSNDLYPVHVVVESIMVTEPQE